MIPTTGCECVPNEQIRDLYPSWATPDDIARSVAEGIKDSMDGGHPDGDHDMHKDHDKKDDDDDSIIDEIVTDED